MREQCRRAGFSVLALILTTRLFLPSNSDDASHDEALSSHIAALNLLDLGLEHLDVDVGSAGSEIDVVVRACGESKFPNPPTRADHSSSLIL